MSPLSMGFSRQEYWSGLPFPSPGDLPDPGIKPRFPALQANTLPSELPGKPQGKSLAFQADTLPSELLGKPQGNTLESWKLYPRATCTDTENISTIVFKKRPCNTSSIFEK